MTKGKPNLKRYSHNSTKNHYNYNYKIPKYSNSAVESTKNNNKSTKNSNRSTKSHNKSQKNNKLSTISNTPEKLMHRMFPPYYSMKIVH